MNYLIFYLTNPTISAIIWLIFVNYLTKQRGKFMENNENNILDKLIEKTTLAAEQLLNTEKLEVKLAENMTEEDEKNPNVIALEKLITITEKLNNMNTKRINAKLKQEKLANLANQNQPNSGKIQSNFTNLPYEEKIKILFKDQDFYRAMHDFPKQVIAKKYLPEALNSIEDKQAYKAVIGKMIAAEKLTLQYQSEVEIIKKISKKELNEKMSNRYPEIDKTVRAFKEEEQAKKELSQEKSSEQKISSKI